MGEVEKRVRKDEKKIFKQQFGYAAGLLLDQFVKKEDNTTLSRREKAQYIKIENKTGIPITFSVTNTIRQGMIKSTVKSNFTGKDKNAYQRRATSLPGSGVFTLAPDE